MESTQAGLDTVSSRALWNVKRDAGDHKGMLNAVAIKKRLAQAMKERPEIKQARIAEATGKTPQAVSAWVKTGQIDPAHFPTLSALFSKPLEYWYGTQSTPPPSRIAEPSVLPSQLAGPAFDNMRLAVETARYWIDFHGLAGSVEDHIPLLALAHELVLEVRRSGVPGTVLDLSKKLAARFREESEHADARGEGAGPGGKGGGVRGNPARGRA